MLFVELLLLLTPAVADALLKATLPDGRSTEDAGLKVVLPSRRSSGFCDAGLVALLPDHSVRAEGNAELIARLPNNPKLRLLTEGVVDAVHILVGASVDSEVAVEVEGVVHEVGKLDVELDNVDGDSSDANCAACCCCSCSRCSRRPFPLPML